MLVQLIRITSITLHGRNLRMVMGDMINMQAITAVIS
jgi:hypothetical protein